jgi:hypothetical protein
MSTQKDEALDKRRGLAAYGGHFKTAANLENGFVNRLCSYASEQGFAADRRLIAPSGGCPLHCQFGLQARDVAVN